MVNPVNVPPQTPPPKKELDASEVDLGSPGLTSLEAQALEAEENAEEAQQAGQGTGKPGTPVGRKGEKEGGSQQQGKDRSVVVETKVSFDLPGGGQATATLRGEYVGASGGSIEALMKEAKRKLESAAHYLERAMVKAEGAYLKQMSAAGKQKLAAQEHLKEAEKMHDGSIVKSIVNLVVMCLVLVVAAFAFTVNPMLGVAVVGLAMATGQIFGSLANSGFEKSAEQNAKAAATAEGEKADLDAVIAAIEKEFSQAWAQFQRVIGKFDQDSAKAMEMQQEISRARSGMCQFS